MPPNKLTDRDKILVDKYILTFDVVASALIAGYSDTVAHTKAYQWVSNSKLNPKPQVYQEIQRRLKKIADKSDVTKEMIIQEYKKLAFSNMGDFADWNGNNVSLIDCNELTLDQTACVSEVSETETLHGGSRKLKLHDKKGALDSLGRHLGMFVDKNINVNLDQDVSTLTDEELLANINKFETALKTPTD